ncbi:MAG: hypothetical protein ABS81_08575 [Pseudonocardia sp. SCN 72-86]|uniref:hypothetical protein n=1 Tax=uncultured Microbacterium sp. TaxID=191216 RepID=UPI00086EFC05|nr:hypothetical protein [uncultured Microbacterium sp.]ODU05069.1 MAG: hypothetical protein ABS81_08575 [Pseudonocardia sp. SCN 72-86]
MTTATINTAHSLFAAIGREIDVQDDRVVREVLFVEEQLPQTRLTSRGPSLAIGGLRKLHEETSNPVLAAIIALRERV